MMRRALFLLAVWTWAAAAPAQRLAGPPPQPAASGTPAFLVEPGHTSFFAWAGVTSAYATDSGIAQAEAVPGGFQVSGKTPGETMVILVTTAGVRTVAVTVPAPPQPRAQRRTQGGSVEDQTVEYGTFQTQYNNNPNQISTMEDITQIAGERRINVQVMNTDIYPASGEAPVGFPVLSYQISHPGRTVTLVDEMMNNSPLTITGVLLRGFHLQQGPWEFHAGITSMTQFQDFLLPSNRWEVAGISRHFRLNSHSALEGNLYYFDTDTSVNANGVPGPLATLVYRYGRGRGLQTETEFGIGKGVAAAETLDSASAHHRLHFDLLYQSPHVAALSIDELHGRTANLEWEQKSRRFQTQVTGDDTAINLATEQQTVDAITPNETWWITRHVALTAGPTASRFLSVKPASPSVRSFGYEAGPQVQSAHWGGSVLIQNLRNGGNLPSSRNYQINAEASGGGVSVQAYYTAQTETPVFAPVQSSQAGLREALQQESEAALTPVQMAHFMEQTRTLETQGFMQPLTVGLATQRKQYGGTIDWTRERVGRVAFNALVDTSEGGSFPSLRLVSGGVIWTRKMGVSNVLNAGFSLFRTVSTGENTLQPSETLSFQHQLNSAPRWLVPGRRAAIDGHVFVDNAFAQAYHPGAPPLAGVLVYLDGRRSTHTDKNGFYEFRGVPWGIHSVEVDYHDSRSFYFTSSSPRPVPAGGTADFGISFAKGRIFGKFTSDAGDGLQVSVTAEGRGLVRQANSNGDGSLEIDGLPDGSYTIHPDASSLPPGYTLSGLADQTVTVTTGKAGSFQYVVPAQRSIGGAVQVYDPTTGRTEPLAGAEVSVGSASMESDSAGRYLFRRLAAGTYSVTVMHGGKSWTRTVQLAATPDIESGVDITITQPSPRPVPSPAPAMQPLQQNQNEKPLNHRRERTQSSLRERERMTPAGGQMR